MFWKKKKEDSTEDSKIVLGMVMLRNEYILNLDSFIQDYNSNYDCKIYNLSGDNLSAAFTIDGETVLVAFMSVPIPSSDIEEAAQYAYNWQNALNEIKEHNCHLIVSVVQGGQNQIKRFKIFTQVLCSLLRTSNAIGVYEGNQSLLIPKGFYLREAELMSEEYLPLNLWIYFGLRVSNNGNSGYTYGLKEFDKTEMEVLNSKNSLEDIRNFLLNITHYVLEQNVSFKDGQTCGLTKDDKILISFSKGQLVTGETFKLAY